MSNPDHITVALKQLVESSKVCHEYFADIGASALRVKDDLFYEMKKLKEAQAETEAVKAHNAVLKEQGKGIIEEAQKKADSLKELAQIELSKAMTAKKEAEELRKKMQSEYNQHRKKLEALVA